MNSINAVYPGVNLEDLEVKIEKYPMGESPRLIENFLIIGYEDLYFQEIIAQNLQPVNFIQEIDNPYIKGRKGLDIKIYLKEYKCRNLPTILSSISSDFNGEMLDGNKIVEKVFPIPPSIYYGTVENHSPEIEGTNVVFTNIQNEVVNIGYGFIFYYLKIVNKLTIYMPKAFVIISQYPYFKIFNLLCEEIKKLYSNDQIQIPIEIQLYNIVNYVPAPVNSNMKMILFPGEDLFEINKCNNQKEFFNLKNHVKYDLAQLSGYRYSDINYYELFSVLPVDTIIEVYLELISGKTIGFFSNFIEILNLTIYIFQQFLFPLSHKENVSSLSPTYFFCAGSIDQNIVGFVCRYEELENFNPFRELKPGEFRFLSEEEEEKNLVPLFFKCDYILDLDKKKLKENDFDKQMGGVNKQNSQLNKYFKNVINGNSKNNNSFLDSCINKLHIKLKDIEYRLTSYSINNSNLINFFEKNNFNEFLNRSILDAFYQFNLNISFFYYLKVSTYNGNYRISKLDQDSHIKSKEDSGLNDDEYLFFYSFSSSSYYKDLENFIRGYSPKVPKICKTPIRIFENLMSLKKILYLMNIKEEYFEHILDIYDSVYIKQDSKGIEKIFEKNKIKDDKKGQKSNENLNQINVESKKEGKDKNKTFVSFFNFYKYYYSSPNIRNYFYNISNADLVKGTINKNNKINIKYLYKYKKIDIDKNILFQYIYLIKKMDANTRKICFTLTEDEMQEKQIITNCLISSLIEKYYINCKFLDNKELIKFSILSIVALTASKHKLVHFTAPIYQIIRSLKFSVHKFIEIILSISLRLFSNEKDKNLFIYEKYFEIYNEGIEKRQLYPNDELIILVNKINEFTKSIQNTRVKIEQEEYKKLLEGKNKNRYTLDYDRKKANIIKSSSYDFERNKIKIIIYFKTKKKKQRLEIIYSFVTVYNKITSILNEYYKDLDYSKINKNELNELIIYLIYFTTIFNEDFPENIKFFLFYCLDYDIPKKKENNI